MKNPQTEIAELRADLALVKAERDAARAALRMDVGVEREQLMFERDVAIGAQLTLQDKLAELREKAEYACDEVRQERDSLHTQLAACQAERDTARAMVSAELLGLEGQVKEAVRRWQEAERSTAEAIVEWLDSGPDLDAPGLQAAANAIRSGAWKGTP